MYNSHQGGVYMEMVEEKSSLKCLQEEVRVFRKNEEAMYDILALYELLVKDTDIHNLVGVTLVEKVIHDLEDPEVTVPVRADSIYAFLKELDNKFYDILNRYKNMEECKEYCDSFNTSYKETIASRDISELFYRREIPSFNLIRDLFRNSSQFVYKFLVSEISFSTRLDMFAYVLGGYRFGEFPTFLQGPTREYLSHEEYQKSSSKIQEIVEAFNHNNCEICRVSTLIGRLVEDEEYGLIEQLQDYGIDFNPCYFKYGSKTEPNLDGKYISTVGAIFNSRESLSSIKDLYEADSYLNVEKTVRRNNDLLILGRISSLELCEFIKLSHFGVTEEKIRFLATSQMQTIEDYTVSELNSVKNHFKKENQEIADTIIRKSKNKEEYKKMMKYSNLFMELTDIEKEIARKKEMAQIQEECMLKQKRQELSTLFYNMNEYAQENVPARVLVKNITFGES